MKIWTKSGVQYEILNGVAEVRRSHPPPAQIFQGDKLSIVIGKRLVLKMEGKVILESDSEVTRILEM